MIDWRVWDTKKGNLFIYTDGSFRNKNINGGGWGYVFIYMGELVSMQCGSINGRDNMVSEYYAIYKALESAYYEGYRRIHLYSDCEVAIDQLIGHSEVRSTEISRYHDAIKDIAKRFDSVKFEFTPRENPYICLADHLCTEAIGVLKSSDRRHSYTAE